MLTYCIQMTIAQIVYDNELHFGYSHDEINQKVYFVALSDFFSTYDILFSLVDAYMDCYGRLYTNRSVFG